MSMVSNTPRQISIVNFSHQRSCLPFNDARRLRFGNVIGCTRTHVGDLRVAVSSSTNSKEVIVVGGGAAGLTAAYFAAKNGAKVDSFHFVPSLSKCLVLLGRRATVVHNFGLCLYEEFHPYTKHVLYLSCRVVFSVVRQHYRDRLILVTAPANQCYVSYLMYATQFCPSDIDLLSTRQHLLPTDRFNVHCLCP